MASNESVPDKAQASAASEKPDPGLKSAYEKAMERAAEAPPEPRAEAQDESAAESTQAEGGQEVSEPVAADSERNSEDEDYKDRYLRACAELENFRLRTKRERETWTADAVRGLGTDLIDVLDNLDMALSSDDVPEGSFATGVTAVRDQFRGILEARGIRRIETKEGQAFDPDIHYALMMEESEAVTGEVVGAVLRPGYRLDNVILRPTQVKVLKGSSAKAQ